MAKRARSEDRQRAKAAKQTKLVAVLGLVFFGAVVFQFAGSGDSELSAPVAKAASSEADQAPAADAAAVSPSDAAAVELPRMELTEMLAADPFVDPDVATQQVAQQPAVPQPRPELPLRAVYGNARGAVALIGRDVVAEGDSVDPSVEVSQIAPGRVTVIRAPR